MDEDEVEKASSEKTVSPDSHPSEGNKATRPPLSGLKATLPETVPDQIQDLTPNLQTLSNSLADLEANPNIFHDTAPAASTTTFATLELVERSMKKAFQYSDQRYEALSGDLKSNVDSLSAYLDKLRPEVDRSTAAVKKNQVAVGKSNKRLEQLETRISGFEGRSIEMIGLLSSIVALVLVTASTANAQSNSFSAYLIILVVAAALMLFACLLHAFFQPQSDRSFRKYWLPFAIMPSLAIVVAGVLAYANSIVKR